MTEYKLSDSITKKVYIPEIFGIYLNSDGSIYKLLSINDGNELKKNSLGSFMFSLKKDCYTIIIIEDDFVSNNINIIKNFDYIDKKPSESQIKTIISNNTDCYIFSMEFNFETGFNSALLYNPNIKN